MTVKLQVTREGFTVDGSSRDRLECSIPLGEMTF